MRVPSGLRALALAVVLPALLAAGCGKKATPTAPPGDTEGVNLLVFRSDRLGAAGQFDVLLYDVDEVGYRSVANLNSSFDESEPCLSNDGTLIAFASDRAGGSGGYDVYLYDRAGQAVVTRATLNTAANETCPRFAYDSVRLAFVRDSAGFGRIRLYDPLGDTLVSLPGLSTGGPLVDTAPAPDVHGDGIAFQTDRAGNWDVRVWKRASGLAVLPDLASADSDVEPSLSANGRWLAFASDRAGGAGGFDVYLYDLVNSAFVPLPGLNTIGDERHPAVSLTGDVLFFQARPTPADHWDLYKYVISSHTLSQPTGLASASTDETQPYARAQ
jgi:Tol biopolymer transport system component